MRGLGLLLLLAPLGLAAASPERAVPDVDPGPVAQRRLTVYDWLQLLPAPEPPSAAAADLDRPRFGWPLRGPLTQPFGCTGFELERPAADCAAGFHTGLDIARGEGVPITAAAAGLAYGFEDPERYGNHVLIQHAGGYATVYAHMVRVRAAWAQPVAAGDVIGWVGSTGNSTGPHLHFEVRLAGAPLDPEPQLAGRPPNPFAVPAGWPGLGPDDWRGRR